MAELQKIIPARPATEESRGIGFPRLYDVLIFLLTRGRERSYRTRVLDLAGIRPRDHVLDIGCGTGTQAIAAWQRAQPGGSVVGIDVAPEMLAAARRKIARAGVDIPLHRADAAALPFPENSFDVVTVTTVMHMLSEAARPGCLAETARVLRRGGRLLIVDYAGDPARRRHLSSRHGRHGSFDLAVMHGQLSALGYGTVEHGALDWLDLHYLRATKA